ncbi:hypothetical protein N8987_06605 [Crocinitomix sp.]|nr:hypothetical protein [Crocinitomix sp.]
MKYFLFVLLLIPSFGFSQELAPYNMERLKLDKNLMTGLGAWSLTNIGIGAVGWATSKGQRQAFHQMNVMWSGVNLALAIPGFFKAKNGTVNGLSFKETYLAQQKTEKIFLFNTALDVFYISGGLFIKERAKTDFSNQDQFTGWGNALLLQGGFLFLFDLTATLLHTQHRKHKLDSFLDRFSMATNGLGFSFSLDQSGFSPIDFSATHLEL